MAKGKDEKHNPNRKVGREHLSLQQVRRELRAEMQESGDDTAYFLDKHAYDDRDLDDKD
jgi:hypothetical protein